MHSWWLCFSTEVLADEAEVQATDTVDRLHWMDKVALVDGEKAVNM